LTGIDQAPVDRGAGDQIRVATASYYNRSNRNRVVAISLDCQ
jgi:hypothetical protein